MVAILSTLLIILAYVGLGCLTAEMKYRFSKRKKKIILIYYMYESLIFGIIAIASTYAKFKFYQYYYPHINSYHNEYYYSSF